MCTVWFYIIFISGWYSIFKNNLSTFGLVSRKKNSLIMAMFVFLLSTGSYIKIGLMISHQQYWDSVYVNIWGMLIQRYLNYIILECCIMVNVYKICSICYDYFNQMSAITTWKPRKKINFLLDFMNVTCELQVGNNTWEDKFCLEYLVVCLKYVSMMIMMIHIVSSSCLPFQKQETGNMAPPMLCFVTNRIS
jgi:hypothetical protein